MIQISEIKKSLQDLIGKGNILLTIKRFHKYLDEIDALDINGELSNTLIHISSRYRDLRRHESRLSRENYAKEQSQISHEIIQLIDELDLSPHYSFTSDSSTLFLKKGTFSSIKETEKDLLSADNKIIELHEKIKIVEKELQSQKHQNAIKEKEITIAILNEKLKFFKDKLDEENLNYEKLLKRYKKLKKENKKHKELLMEYEKKIHEIKVHYEKIIDEIELKNKHTTPKSLVKQEISKPREQYFDYLKQLSGIIILIAAAIVALTFIGTLIIGIGEYFFGL